MASAFGLSLDAVEAMPDCQFIRHLDAARRLAKQRQIQIAQAILIAVEEVFKNIK